MIIIEPGYEILRPAEMDERSHDEMLQIIETAARTCYKSEIMKREGSAGNMVKSLIRRGHEAMLEHAVMTVRWTVDIAVGREMTRHRIASYAQESTRYCNYSRDRFGGEITFIRPERFEAGSPSYMAWKRACSMAENEYMNLLEIGETPEWARSVLPLSTKAELVSTMNLREWRWFFKLRAADITGPAHPQMKQVAVPLLKEMQGFLPEVFCDILTEDVLHE